MLTYNKHCGLPAHEAVEAKRASNSILSPLQFNRQDLKSLGALRITNVWFH